MEHIIGNIERHLHHLCLFPSRHVGSPGVNKAIDYIAETFQGLGYQDVSKEPFPTTGWRFGSMVFQDLDNGAVSVPGALPCFFSQQAEITDVPVWLTEKSLRNLDADKVRNRLCVVEFFSDAADIRGRNGIAEELDRAGAAAAVFISDSTYHTTCAASTKIQRSPDLVHLGTAVVAEEGAYYLYRNRSHRFHLGIDAETFPATSYNVAAIRPGTGNKRAVFGAHHDAAPLTQGASDNASGVACLLEMARLLKDQLPEWTFEFVSFDAEEYCINPGYPGGSEAYTRSHQDRKWEFFMNFDSIGIAFGDDMLHVGRAELLPDFETIYPRLPIKLAGDDRNFDRIGVPSLWFNTHAKFNDFHTPLDTMETLDLAKLETCINEAIHITHALAAPL